MAQIENGHVNGTTGPTDAKKHKRFWSNIFSRSSKKTDTDEKQDEKKHKGFMDSLMTNARDAAAKEVMHLAEHEAMKEVESELNKNGNSSGSQSPNTAPTAHTVDVPDTSTPSEVLSVPTNWAKRVVDSVQQKVQGLQNLASP